MKSYAITNISGRCKRINDNCVFKSVLKHRHIHSTTNSGTSKKNGQTMKIEQSIPSSLQTPEEFSAAEVDLCVTGKDGNGRKYILGTRQYVGSFNVGPTISASMRRE
jgi:hypothetical protein